MKTLRRLRIRCAVQYTGDFQLPVEFVYDAFTLAYEGFNNFNADSQVLLKDHLSDIKEYISLLFKELLAKQIKKYLGRPDRLKPGSEAKIQEIYKSGDMERYPEVFNVLTLRSPSHVDEAGGIPNLRWGLIVNKVLQIKKELNPSKIIGLLTDVGGLYNLVHNTKTPVLEKFGNGRNLLRALDECDSVKNPKLLALKASGVVKDALENIEGSAVEQKTHYAPVQKGYKYQPGYYGD